MVARIIGGRLVNVVDLQTWSFNMRESKEMKTQDAVRANIPDSKYSWQHKPPSKKGVEGVECIEYKMHFSKIITYNNNTQCSFRALGIRLFFELREYIIRRHVVCRRVRTG